jgi:3-oxoacyl-[acyl-carrier-protein] synthase-1
MTGHECWMAGASEVIYSILMMQNDFVAPNINLENPDNEAQKINLISKQKIKKLMYFCRILLGLGEPILH